MNLARSAVVVAAALSQLNLGCAPPPRPAVLAQAEGASRSPASVEASKLVPQAFARADQLRNEAEEAWRSDQRAAAAILAERAVVAYEHAAVLAEIVRAAKVAEAARLQLVRSEKELSELDAEQARLAADAEALEVRIRALKDAEAPAVSGKADPEREAARLSAARTIVMDARLLCASARLLDAKAAGLQEAETQVQSLEQSLSAGVKSAPIDEARRTRARCLAVLTGARRSSSVAPATGLADVVLAELSSKTSLGPTRDDRGVVVGLAAEVAIKPAGGDKAVLGPLAAVAVAHPEFPLLVVAHARAAGAADGSRAKANAEALSRALQGAGVKPERIRIEQASPVHGVGGKGRSPAERLELVFVSPGT